LRTDVSDAPGACSFFWWLVRQVVTSRPLPTIRRPRSVERQQIKGTIMNIIIWLVIGGLIGWVASIVMRTDGRQGLLLNVVVGIVGSLLGGWLLSPLVGVSTINQSNFSLAGLLVSLAGAVILLAIVNLVQRRVVR
jgi:uncharacterized membrane protein YeaQ/YmgE (transglycosylase-associated protein family)